MHKVQVNVLLPVGKLMLLKMLDVIVFSRAILREFYFSHRPNNMFDTDSRRTRDCLQINYRGSSIL